MSRNPKVLKDAVLTKLIEADLADYVPTGTFTGIAREADIVTNTVYQLNMDLKRKERLAARGSWIATWCRRLVGSRQVPGSSHPKQ